jgi:hypothetical protein
MPSYFIKPDEEYLFKLAGINELNVLLDQIELHIRNEAIEQGIHLVRLNCYFNTLINEGLVHYETKYTNDYLEIRNMEVGLGLYIHKFEFLTNK